MAGLLDSEMSGAHLSSDEMPDICAFNYPISRVYSTSKFQSYSQIEEVNIIVEFESDTHVYFIFSNVNKSNVRSIFGRLVDHIAEHWSGTSPRKFEIEGAGFKYTIRSLEEELEKKAIISGRLPANPEKWPGSRKTKEELPRFFERVWGDYIPKGLTFADIRHKDRGLYRAINNWRNRDKLPWPLHLQVPKQSQILSNNLSLFLRGSRSLTPKEMVAVTRKLERDANRRATRPAKIRAYRSGSQPKS